MIRNHFQFHEIGVPYHYEFYCGTVKKIIANEEYENSPELI